MIYLIKIKKWPNSNTIFNRETVKIVKVFNDIKKVEKYFKTDLDIENWDDFGYFWTDQMKVIIDLEKFKTCGNRNRMIEPWKSFVNYDNVNRFLRYEKLKNI